MQEEGEIYYVERETFFIVIAIGLSLIVLRYYLARKQWGNKKDENETSPSKI